MKLGKKLAALLAVFALVLTMMTPAAFADEVVYETLTNEDIENLDFGSTPNYQIGTGYDGDFKATNTISGLTSNLTLRLYCDKVEVKDNKTGYVAGADGIKMDEGSTISFSAQDSKVYVYGDKTYIDITGLKYTKINDNDFKATLFGKYTTTRFEVLECAKVSTPTAEPQETPKPTSTPDPRSPGLIIKSSSIGTSAVNAGDAFTLTLTVYATSSGTEAINDVVVSITPEKGVVITGGSSTQYIGTMQPGATTTVSYPMQALAEFTESVSSVAVTLSGTGAVTGTAAPTTGTTIAVPVRQADRFEISKLEVPETLTVGEEGTCTISFVNKGRNAVGNLTVTLNATNLTEEEQSEYVGNVNAGTEDSVDFELSPVEGGEVTGTITLVYEAASGDEVTLTQDISVSVDEPVYEDYGEENYEEYEEEPTGLPTAAKIAIAAAVVAAIAGAVVLIRKRRAKKPVEDDDEDL